MEGVGHFMSKSLRMAVWYWEQPVDKAGVEALMAYGLAHNETNVAMVAELAVSNIQAPRPEGLTINYADNPHQIQQYGTLIARAFNNAAEASHIAAYFDVLSSQPMSAFPAMRHYLGTYQNKVVASGALFVGSETVGIYDIITHPDHRHRGIGSAMFAHLLDEAKAYQRLCCSASIDGGYRDVSQGRFCPCWECAGI